MNPYDVLEVSENADDATIKASYKAKAQTLHPDKGGDPLAFTRLAEAYRTLKGREDPVDVKMRQLFEIILSNDSFHGDLIAEARRIVNETLEAGRKRQQGRKVELDRLKAMVSRVDDPQYQQAVDDRIVQVEQELQRAIDQVRTINDVVDRLNNLKDANPDPSWMPTGGFGGV